jgi:hypothetical protein
MTKTSLLIAALLVSACSGDDGDDSTGSQRACIVDDSCFDSRGGTGAEVTATCNNLDGMLVDACEGARAGCCKLGSVTQCYYGDADADALADLCASQNGVWTPN